MFKICVLLMCVLGPALAFNMTEYEELLIEVAEDPQFLAEFDRYLEEIYQIEPNYHDYYPKGLKFDCDRDPDPTVPTSVHRLRPQDIKVVGALGDSLTAALGANARTVFGLLLEYRGFSWSMGGKDQLDKRVTLPNVLRKFNPNLFGFNTGSTIALTTKEGKGFNAAVSGQEANHAAEQASRLVQRLKESKQVNLKDWKMITLFVGGNDICDYCKDKNLHSPKQYIADVEAALDILYANLPNTFVNLVTVLNVNEVKKLNLNFVCNTLHKWSCPCASYPENAAEEKELIDAQTQYQQLVEDLVNSGKYDKRDDFTVVVQPLFKGFQVPLLPDGKVDKSLFAPDCFHLSAKGHTLASISLWNNLLQPVGQKKQGVTHDAKLICPKDFPYFYTNRNSAKPEKP